MVVSRPHMALVVTTGFDIYHQQLVHGVLPVLNPHGLTLVVNSVNVTGRRLPASVAQLIRTVSPYGVIATTCSKPEEEEDLFSLLDHLGIPAVLVAVRRAERSYVHGDDRTGMRELMAHLLDECGVRRPALARGVPHQTDAIVREQVFREELAVRGIPVDEDLVFEGNFWHEDAYRELRALLHRRRDMDAVVASNDISALGVLKALTDEGLRVPEDILVTGFDNESIATLAWPGLTTVDQDAEGQGEAAASLLIEQLINPGPREPIIIPSQLVIRGPTAPWGRTEQDDFINQVIEIETALEPLALLQDLQKIEIKMGRQRQEKWGPRIIDLDILLFGDEVLDFPELKVPHPLMRQRLFVLVPLPAVNAELIFPDDGAKIKEVLISVLAREGNKKIKRV